MPQTGANFENTFNNPTTGLFKDNTTKDIGADDSRSLVTAVKESYLNRLDDAQIISYTPSTAGGTITLDFSATVANQKARHGIFTGSASFATSKAVALSNDDNAVKFELGIQITDVAATLDFGSGSVFKSNHNDFTPGTQIFAPSQIGFILIRATKVGSNWWLTFEYGFT